MFTLQIPNKPLNYSDAHLCTCASKIATSILPLFYTNTSVALLSQPDFHELKRFPFATVVTPYPSEPEFQCLSPLSHCFSYLPCHVHLYFAGCSISLTSLCMCVCARARTETRVRICVLIKPGGIFFFSMFEGNCGRENEFSNRGAYV